jgi:hypothetical protein
MLRRVVVGKTRSARQGAARWALVGGARGRNGTGSPRTGGCGLGPPSEMGLCELEVAGEVELLRGMGLVVGDTSKAR